MKKKIILGAGVGLILIIVIATVVVGFFLGDIVKKGIETVGPKITQTSLTVSSVNIALMTGSVGVNKLVVGNPEGYQTTNAISVGKAAVSVTPSSIFADKIIIKSIEVRSPQITFEGNPFGANNLKKIMDNVNSLTGGSGPVDTNKLAAAGANKAAKKLEVDNFALSGAQVHARITGIPGVDVQELTLPIPDIQFSDLGKGPDGITAAELTQLVLQKISTDTIKAVGDNARNLLNGAAKNIISGVTTNGLKGASDSVNGLKKGLGGLLGK